MKTDQLTFNDLPAVVGELCDRIASMENLLTEKLSKQHEVKENTHVPMTVQEACAYLKMPLSTFYYKVKKDDIVIDLLLQGQKRRYSSHQARETSIHLPG